MENTVDEWRMLSMQNYLAAHDEFIAWLDGLQGTPTTSEVDGHLMALALCAAARGMTETHWIFVVDGLIAHVNRMAPGNIFLSSAIARGFDLATGWDNIRIASIQAMSNVCAKGGIG
jgi:hypothetical protein